MRVCMALVPRGKRNDTLGRTIDCDEVYDRLVRPGATSAGWEVVRVDSESWNVTERLLVCDRVIVLDVDSSPALSYELGLREAIRPGTAILLSNGGTPLPCRILPFSVDRNGMVQNPDSAELAAMLREDPGTSNPARVYELLEGMPGTVMLDHLKTDVLRERLRYSEQVQEQLRAARSEGAEAVRRVEARLGALAEVEFGVALDLLLSFRAVRAWTDMIATVERMSPVLRASAMVQEQLALALNRARRFDDAERVLRSLLERRGPRPETCAILGRVYKDRYTELRNQGSSEAAAMLDRAIGAYLAGFEADWRDAYPGINALMLMELRDPPDERRHVIRPVVEYAIGRKLATGPADYWDSATQVELAVLARDEKRASVWLATALAVVRERWEPETTARNLSLIRGAREGRGEESAWIAQLEARLVEYAQRGYET